MADGADDDDADGVSSAGSGLDIELGFAVPIVDEPPPVELLDAGRWDGGKAGGFPAWLHGDTAALPSVESLRCATCGAQLAFLLQLYAPLDAVVHAFHRSLFVFACLRDGCVNRPMVAQDGGKWAPSSVVALRAQARNGAAELYRQGCAVCGLPSAARCGKCHRANYCGRDHQVAHWKAGHKGACGAPPAASGAWPEHSPLPAPPPLALQQQLVLPAFEIAVEHEPSSSQRRRAEVRALPPGVSIAEGVTAAGNGATISSESIAAAVCRDASGYGGDGDLSLSDISQSKLALITGSHMLTDAALQHFQRRVAVEPSQIVRYCRWPSPAEAAVRRSCGVAEADADTAATGLAADEDDADDDDEVVLPGAPLWLSESHRVPAAAVPPCERCGAPRAFEFQVMPQLIHMFGQGAASLDFGTLAVYTCTASCDIGTPAAAPGYGLYQREFVWVQPAEDAEERELLRARLARAADAHRLDSSAEGDEACQKEEEEASR